MREIIIFAVIVLLLTMSTSGFAQDRCGTTFVNDIQGELYVIYPTLNTTIRDEKQIAFYDLHISTISPTTACSLILKTHDLSGLPDVWLSATFPAWSPDGERIAFIGQEHVLDTSSDQRPGFWSGWRGPRENPFLYYFSGDIARDLGIGYTEDVYTGPITWSVDGFVAVVYQGLKDGQWEWRTEIRGADGYPFYSVTPTNTPTWSPTQSTLVTRRFNDELSNLSLDRFKGGEREGVVLTAGYDRNEHPVWTPDGMTIGFSSNREGAFDIFTILPDGTGLIQITAGEHTNEDYPSWSPNGDWLTYIQSDVESVEPTYDFAFRQWPDGETYIVTPPSSIWPHYKWLPDNSGVLFYMHVDDEHYALHWLEIGCATSESGCVADDFNLIPNTETHEYYGFDVTDHMNLQFEGENE